MAPLLHPTLHLTGEAASPPDPDMQPWIEEANCAGISPEAFAGLETDEDRAAARQVCVGCVALDGCARYAALHADEVEGVMIAGGANQEEREVAVIDFQARRAAKEAAAAAEAARLEREAEADAVRRAEAQAG